MKNKNKDLQAAKVAAANTLITRVVKDKTKYSRKEKHKNKAYHDEKKGKPYFFNFL